MPGEMSATSPQDARGSKEVSAEALGEPRVFIPDRALQGSDIPIHITWEGPMFEALRIQGIRDIKEEHNIARSEHSGDIYQVDELEYPGYVGIVVSSELADSPSTHLELELRVTLDGETHETEHKVYLYRPQIEVAGPGEIQVLREGDAVQAGSPLTISNTGEGTAILELEVTEPGSTESLLTEPHQIEEFRAGMRDDLERRLPTLVDAYPHRANLLEPFPSLFFDTVGVDDTERLTEIDEFMADLVVAMDNEEGFGNDLIETIIWAYANNLELVTVIGRFVDYLEAVGDNKTFFTNPVDTLQIPKGGLEVDISVRMTDRALNRYEPVKIEGVHIASDEEVDLPVHEMVRLGGDRHD